MAELKNTFIKSKMNKDLDDRIVPNGEYRDALNVAISRSEGDDVGALETILGNELYFDEQNKYTCIGLFADSQNTKIYYFVTNYTDASADGLSNFAPVTAHCSVRMYDTVTTKRTILVQGSFLNFSARSQITGINIIENLLFWTDNRNQPRKINIEKASAFPAAPPQSGRSTQVSIPTPYYTKEDQISVAKYYPYRPIILMDLYNTNLGNTPENSTMSNPSQALLPNGSVNPAYDANWAGDPDYLTDKFIRLSYRFRFDDNEYSLMAPFTQPCFVPKQNGYFLDGDNEKAYRSTIVEFFENNATQIIANIQFDTNTPDKDLKIKELDILYKESDGLQVKVIETIPIQDVIKRINENYARTGGNGYVYDYKYISTKPYKNLPEEDIIRVYDKVPVRALAQEVSGNRVIYGNFYTTQTPPNTLDYYVTYGDKSELLGYSPREYPNHTLKQNRNYQVGFILSDKYGRQSSVILSSNDDALLSAGSYYGGSTVYVPYAGSSFDTINWPGYALQTLVNSPIPTSLQNDIAGYPGLYKDESYGVDATLVEDPGLGYTPSAGAVYTTTNTTGTGSGLTVKVAVTGGGGSIDYALIQNPGTGYVDGDIVTIDDPGATTLATLNVTVLPPNPTGWYSYKIVVKQTEQDYYNCYLPGILKGYPSSYINNSGVADPTFEENESANIVLINDNINKIPRDLNEVGPQQRQFRSSIELFGRVEPVNNNAYNYNKQYYATSKGDFATIISDLSDANYNNLTGQGADPGSFDINYKEFYQSNTDPLIARLSTSGDIGKTSPADPTPYLNQLAVYETGPTESLLNIYWETTSSGLIKDLNAAVLEGDYEGAVQTAGYTFVLTEDDLPGSYIFGGRVSVVNGFSNLMFDDMEFELVSITDGHGVDRSSDFVFEQQLGGTPANPDGFNILTAPDAYFYCGPDLLSTTFTIRVQCTYTNPVTLDVTSSVVTLSNLEVGNVAPNFITSIACPSSNQPSPQPAQTIGSPTNGDNLVWTFYAENGVACESGESQNDLRFAQDPANLLDTSRFRFQENPNEPGVIELYVKEGAIPTNTDVYVKVFDARGASRIAYVNITITPAVQIQIDLNPSEVTCIPDGYSWTQSGGRVRMPVNIAGLVSSGIYDYQIIIDQATNATVSNAPLPDCGFPGGLPSGQIVNPIPYNRPYYLDFDFTDIGFSAIYLTIIVEDTDPNGAIRAEQQFIISGQTVNAAASGAVACGPDGCPVP